MSKPSFKWTFVLTLFLGLNLSTMSYAQTLTDVGFGKMIDLHDWSTKMRMSFDQLVTAVQPEVSIFRFDLNYMGPENKSVVFQNLPYLSKDLMKAYSHSLVMARSRAMYVGEDELDNPINKPLILIRMDSEHWTLIHEYTHHLFHKARKMTGFELPINYKELYTKYNEQLDLAYNQYKSNSNSFKSIKEMNDVSQLLAASTSLTLNLQSNFFLEEIVIENMIRNYYLKNPLDQAKMNLQLYANSISYVEKNFNRITDNLKFLKSILVIFQQGTQPGSSADQLIKKSLIKVLKFEEQVKSYKIVKLKTSEDI